jgi:hypothetical protein
MYMFPRVGGERGKLCRSGASSIYYSSYKVTYNFMVPDKRESSAAILATQRYQLKIFMKATSSATKAKSTQAIIL